MKILAAGIPLRLKARLVGRLKEFDVQVFGTGKELLEAFRQGPAPDLILLDEDVKDPDPIEVLEGVPRAYRGSILFCARQGHSEEFLEVLVRRLRVSAILQHPVDADELVRRVAAELAVKVPAAPPEEKSGIASALVPVWKKHEQTNQERVGLLQQVCKQGVEDFTEDTREEARRAAHQLAGSLGTFGLSQGSLLAREAEELIQKAPELSEEQQARLATVVRAIELQLADPSVHLAEEAPAEMKGSLFVLSDNPDLVESLEKSAKTWQVMATADPAGARKLLAVEQPKGLVIDMSDSLMQEGLNLLQELRGRGATPKRVVAIVPSMGWLPLAECELLVKPAHAKEVLRALEKEPAEPQRPRTRILAVDDDPIVLETLQALLKNLHVEVHTLQNPLGFWDTLQKVKPELLILDIDLPYLGGIELCRAVRSDPAFSRVPILFLSAYTDAETVNRVFQAGGDDYVYKPIVGPELLTRVSNRLERARAYGAEMTETPRPERVEADVAYDVQDEKLFSLLGERGFRLEPLTEDLALDQHPRVILIDNLDLLTQLDALGVTSRSQVWLVAELAPDEICEVYARGAAGYIPAALDREKLARRLERALVG